MADETLRVDPVVMQSHAVSIAGAAEHLSAELSRLDDQVSQMLGGWQGASGSAYASAWELWHRGAREVQLGLSMLGHLVGQAGEGYQANEAGSAQAERAVRGG
ncbi:secretion protein [Mycobacterium sp. E3251]|uniref:WXG100 family type VII secretion target n=1 Tax=unclassified Mycobacterium TaxID=2642494 RepID=UPI0007FD44CD|nr:MULTISPECIES: WXG100 family type VII secretion target [unclassified Mycobacterium]OBG92282.1 secretion protein [Mycobacterium sp. E3251]OBI32136.1 secretion protein [Mycobacterium sp. E1386]OBI34928.1 secretion protein [Mycobacterium sp. E2238]